MKKSIFKYSFIAIVFCAAFALDTGCKKESMSPAETPATAPTPGSTNVNMQGTSFSPRSVTVAVNTTVTWTNGDSMAHTVTSDSGAFDSGTINVGGTYSFKFTTKGAFPYHCNFHSGMTGTVVVQ
jgi:plastocyanin